jgi:hypothetical protein
MATKYKLLAKKPYPLGIDFKGRNRHHTGRSKWPEKCVLYIWAWLSSHGNAVINARQMQMRYLSSTDKRMGNP